MKHIEHNLRSIKRRIMMRVWYSYVLSLLTRGGFFYGFALGGAVALFGRLTHVAAITHNLLEIPLGGIPNYVWTTITGALAGGEILTVLITASIVLMTAGALRKLRDLFHTEAQTA
ncbi:hypothetical protein A2Z56_01560 [Candidatus Kaiserbacteria bacterium RIFCSPHIGHO2_12_45_16]|nr:MAG: hypothetical protein A2Z56_01560 [Candidatus Kaiserbacteria bacterium RIFCSPHIGHO2_12_45_16]